MTLPVPSDARLLSERLAAEERELLARLAALEARVRHFADVERPAYASWRRLAFGPLLATLDELSAEVRMRSVLADRVTDMVDRGGLHPREALYLATDPAARAERPAGGGFDPDEVEARRRARLERKRERRRQAKRAKRAAERTPDGASADANAAAARPRRVVDLYRMLARRLHPDSPTALRTVAPDRLGGLWADVQDAYESGSLDRLLAIAAWVEMLGDTGEGEADPRDGASRASGRRPLLSLSERYDRLRTLCRALRAVERDLARLRIDPAWDFAAQQRTNAGRLARRTRGAIDDEIAGLRRALAELDAFFADIGPPRAPRTRRGR